MRRLGLVILSGLILTSAFVYGRTQGGAGLQPNPDLRSQTIKVTLTNCKPTEAMLSGEQTVATGITCSANQVMNGIRISSSPYKQTFQAVCCDVGAQR